MHFTKTELPNALSAWWQGRNAPWNRMPLCIGQTSFRYNSGRSLLIMHVVSTIIRQATCTDGRILNSFEVFRLCVNICNEHAYGDTFPASWAPYFMSGIRSQNGHQERAAVSFSGSATSFIDDRAPMQHTDWIYLFSVTRAVQWSQNFASWSLVLASKLIMPDTLGSTSSNYQMVS